MSYIVKYKNNHFVKKIHRKKVAGEKKTAREELGFYQLDLIGASEYRPCLISIIIGHWRRTEAGVLIW
jgi:hypothetical protein